MKNTKSTKENQKQWLKTEHNMDIDGDALSS